MIKYYKDTDDIVTLTFDMKNSRVNIINHNIAQILQPILEQLIQEKQRKALNGVIITSAKRSFLMGGQLDYLYQTTDAATIFQWTEQLKQIYRQLETLAIPVVAAINGSAVGIGYEITLACHYRIAVETSTAQIGLPEIRFGLIPSSGAITRLVWQLGLSKAFPILTMGKTYRPLNAQNLGLIHAVVSSKKELLSQAKHWILSNPTAQQRWDKPNAPRPYQYQQTPTPQEWIPQTIAQLNQQTHQHYPAQQTILDTMVTIANVDFDTGSRIESRQFTKIVLSPTFKNMAKTFWYDLNAIKKNISRPKGFGKFRPRKIGIIGAGQMGSAIAYACATSGLQVVLKDVSKPIAERGKAHIGELLDTDVIKCKLTPQEKTTIFKRINTTERFEDFETCDVVLEAVFENLNLKRRVIRETEQYLDEFTLFGTNTSSLSISRLAKASSQPENFIGLRFFPPAENHPLVEVICGKNTADETLARAYDFIKKIGKTPIVVHDRRGFYTSRVSEMYALEGIALLNEGVSPVKIERLGKHIGMSVGPLALADERSLATTLKFEKRKQEKYRETYYHPKELSALEQMVNQHQRPGKGKQGGFYTYSPNQSPHLWTELSEHFPSQSIIPSQQDIVDRLAFIQAIEAARCYEEQTITNVADANVGSVYGWRFIPFKGGVLQFINDYGVVDFVKRAKILAERYGTRFDVPKLLKEMAENKVEF